MEVKARNVKETAREYAFRTLRRNIVTLNLSPGSMVSEKELALEMGISRTPTREALIELSKSQIVDIFPQKGSYISKIDYELVDEARFMRLVLEKAVIELVCDIASEDDLYELERIIRQQRSFLEAEAIGKFFQMDNDFHRHLFVIANKMQMYHLMDSMMIHFDRVRMLRLHHRQRSAGTAWTTIRAIVGCHPHEGKSKIEAVSTYDEVTYPVIQGG